MLLVKFHKSIVSQIAPKVNKSLLNAHEINFMNQGLILIHVGKLSITLQKFYENIMNITLLSFVN